LNTDIHPTRTEDLAHRLRMMAETGGMLTRERRRILMEAAGRLSELDEAVKIMQEHGGEGNEIS